MGSRFFISSGEPSGDIHAGNLARAIRRLDHSASFVGYGGPRLRESGCEILEPLAERPIMGLWAGIKSIPRMAAILKEARARLQRERPSAVVLIDNPGFNFQLARVAKSLGIPVVYHVAPQLWAWGHGRERKMARHIDLVLCSLPFEEAWYHSHGIPQARYVGHPYFDDMPSASAGGNRDRASRPERLLLLPGSRAYEVRRNLRSMLEVAGRLRSEFKDLHVDVAAYDSAVEQVVREASRAMDVRVEVSAGKSREMMMNADLALAVSGSVSLELLYYGVPSVIVYRTSWFTDSVLKPMLLKTPYVTIVNLLAGRRLFPEFFGKDDSTLSVVSQLGEWMCHPEQLASIRQQLSALRNIYAQPGASDQAARLIMELSLPRSLTQAA